MDFVRLVCAWIPFGWCFGFITPESTRHANAQKGLERIAPGLFGGKISPHGQDLSDAKRHRKAFARTPHVPPLARSTDARKLGKKCRRKSASLEPGRTRNGRGRVTATGPGRVHFAVDAVQTAGEFLLREVFGQSVPKGLKGATVDLARFACDPGSEKVQLSDRHLEESGLKRVGRDGSAERCARSLAAAARRGPKVAKGGRVGKLRQSGVYLAATDTLFGQVSRVPRDVELLVDDEQAEKELPFRQRMALLFPRDRRFQTLDAFVLHLAEDDELDSRKQGGQSAVCFVETRKNRFRSQFFHGIPLTIRSASTPRRRFGVR